MTDTHPCPGPGCDVTDVPDDLLMCRSHWFAVPRPLRAAVLRAWGGGSGAGSDALRRAQGLAIDSLRRKEAGQ